MSPARTKQTKKTSPPRGAARAEKPIGTVTHYYGGIGVAIVKFTKPVKVNTIVSFRGTTTSFTQLLASLEYDHRPLTNAPKGKEVGVKVNERVREGDSVYLA